MNGELKDPGVPVRSERASIRINVLRILRDHASTLRMLVSTWDSGRRVWGNGAYANINHPGHPQWWRWRTWYEYPENDPKLMRRHAVLLRAIAYRFVQLAIQLDEQADKAHEVAKAREEGP